eukprot:7302162-Pyramimonas_sp.AAC.1
MTVPRRIHSYLILSERMLLAVFSERTGSIRLVEAMTMGLGCSEAVAMKGEQTRGDDDKNDEEQDGLQRRRNEI